VKLRDIGTGLPYTGLTASSTGAHGTYTRERSDLVTFSLVQLLTAHDPWVAGGFFELDAVNQKGAYRLDTPDAAAATGAPYFTAGIQANAIIADLVLVRLEKITSNAGSGSTIVTVTVINSVTLQPLVGAKVWITTDAAGTNVIAGTLTTNTSGQAVFFLDTGTYYAWCADPGYQGTLPIIVVVP
jgi:hypothetical protein